MNAADGSDKTLLPVESQSCPEPGGGIFEAIGLVSRIKHNDHYWFLRQGGIFDENGDPELYPDGVPRHELFVVRDDNGYNIQLTDDATLAIYGRGHEKLVWGIDDSNVLFVASKWVNGEQDMNSFGIYSVDLEFDTNGLPGLTGDLTFIWDTGSRYLLNQDRYTADVTAFDISPDGNKLVITKRVGTPIFVVDLIQRTTNQIASGWFPRWSPDGTKIAFCDGNLYTINPDGSDEQIIVRARSYKGGFIHVMYYLCWSPDSNFIAYKALFDHQSKSSNDLYRVRADGEDDTCLTKDGELGSLGSKSLKGWR
jgi:hypothetical protein